MTASTSKFATNKRALAIITSLAVFALTHSAHANDNTTDDDKSGLQIGATAIVGNTPYDTDGTEVRVLPSLFYDNGKVYARGSQVGGYLLQDRQNELAGFIQPGGYEFEPKDANGDLQGLNEREISGLAGLSYVRRTPIGGFRAQVATDILGNSEGTVARLAYLSRFQNGKFTVYPSVGVEWVNDTYNDYYFGVSSTESARTGVTAYDAEPSISPYINVNVNYDLNQDWSLIFGQNVAYLSDEQYDSPMVNDRVTYRTMFGANYRF